MICPTHACLLCYLPPHTLPIEEKDKLPYHNLSASPLLQRPAKCQGHLYYLYSATTLTTIDSRNHFRPTSRTTRLGSRCFAATKRHNNSTLTTGRRSPTWKEPHGASECCCYNESCTLRRLLRPFNNPRRLSRRVGRRQLLRARAGFHTSHQPCRD